MQNYKYVNQKEYQPVKNDLINLIHLVQNEIRDKFTFSYEFIGSASRNMVTVDTKSNRGYDLDVNIRVNDDDENYSPEEIKQILIRGFNAHCQHFNYDFCEDSKRVITLKNKDYKHSGIIHSCDFAIVFDCSNGKQQYIHFNKNQRTYEWQYQPKGFYDLPEKVKRIKENNLWNAVRERYLEKKNTNTNPNKKSRSIYAETISEIYNKYFN